MGTIPSRREDRGLTPLRLRAWISVSAAAKWLILKEGIGAMRPSDGTSGLVRGNRRKAVFVFTRLFSEGYL